MSWAGSGDLRIAVLVIGQYRVFDGVWPSHLRFMYEPIRRHERTQTLDVFTCTDTGKLPIGMPKPAAAFVFNAKVQTDRIPLCFAKVVDWANKSKSSSKVYDYFIRSRPDIEFVGPIDWPMPNLGDPRYADVYSTINLGNIRAYPWSSNVSTAMLAHAVLIDILASHGKCNVRSKTMHSPRTVDPCVDISDQIAVVNAEFAPAYFEHPKQRYSEWPGKNNYNNYMSRARQVKDPVMRDFACTSMWGNPRWPNEGRLNYRLRKAGATLAPWNFAFFLAPSRKKAMSCKNSINGNLESCLIGRQNTEFLRKTSEIRASVLRAQHTPLSCIFGSENASIPASVDRWSSSSLMDDFNISSAVLMGNSTANTTSVP